MPHGQKSVENLKEPGTLSKAVKERGVAEAESRAPSRGRKWKVRQVKLGRNEVEGIRVNSAFPGLLQR